MTIAGWIMLAASWAAIAGLTGFAMWRTLRAKPRNELTAPIDIEAQIEERERRDPGSGGRT